MFTQRNIAGGDGPLRIVSGPAAGMPLVFLHGVGRSWHDFYNVMPALAWRWHVVGLDFRGHGQSARTPEKYLVRDYVLDAVALVRDHLAAPCVLYGHSLGAMVAAATAAELPELVRAVVLEDPPFETLGPAIHKTQFHSLFQIMRAASGSPGDVDDAARALAEQRVAVPGADSGVRLGDVRDPTALRFMAACLQHVDPTLWQPILDGRWLEGYDKAAVLTSINAPTLLLYGDVGQGGMVSESAALEIEQLVRRCVRQRVAGAGHLIHSLQAEATLRLVGAFLESVAISEQV